MTPLGAAASVSSADTAAGRRLRDFGSLPASVESALPPEGAEWPIPREVARFLARVILHDGRRRVLEFGAGRSSVVMALALAHATAHATAAVGDESTRASEARPCLTSVDHAPEYSADAWREVQGAGEVDSLLVVSSLRPMWFLAGRFHAFPDAASAIARRAPYDLVVIDAPPRDYGRDGSLHMAARFLAPGALVVLDDAARPQEQATLARWARCFPSMSPVIHERSFCRGLAVLSVPGPMPTRVCFSDVFASAWARRRDRRTGQAPVVPRP